MNPAAGRQAARPARSAAADRILAAAADCVMRTGVANTSVQDVANAAAVSKGLIHYHFRDKAALLATLTEWLVGRIVGRQRAATGHVRPENAIDLVWSWAEGELAGGDIRSLAALSLDDNTELRAAAQEALLKRRAAATEMVAAVYAALELTPRVPSALLAEAFVAFLDGMAVTTSLAEPVDQRVAFDAFWLALLTLGD